jgi:hypothetical protein
MQKQLKEGTDQEQGYEIMATQLCRGTMSVWRKVDKENVRVEARAKSDWKLQPNWNLEGKYVVVTFAAIFVLLE